MASAASPRKYDVFLSFRGETRNNFTSHLHDALKRAYLEVFRDDEKLEKGEEIAPSLVHAIKDSSVSVIVFSQDYASSRWCLDELAQIMQYRKEEGQFVIPIFYKVDPSDVRNQTGDYEKIFKEHERKHGHEKVNRWRVALSEAGKLSGLHCQIFTDESKLIQEIVTDVSSKLECIYKCQGTLKDVIGIDEIIEPIEKLLEKNDKVGIWGMGGVGKTTMAKALFVKLSCWYDTCCFLENVRQKTERNGLQHVHNSLVSELLGQDVQSNPSSALRNDAFVARRLRSKNALVVLDDVDSTEQLKELQCKICNSLGEGSKVIITTRDKKLLRGKGYEIHEVKGLSYENSCRLFIRKAFGSDNLEDGYEDLIEGFVDYTKQNPLALQVLGSLVYSEDKKLWNGLLRKLQAGKPNHEIQKALRSSYEGLDNDAKQIFLDIACFLKGESEEFVEELLESYGFDPIVGMKTLIDRALIVTTSGKVDMHDLLQEMGHQIVYEESINEPGKRSRLWNHDEISKVFKNCEGGKEVEGIYGFGIRSSCLTDNTFKKMTRLRFLKMDTYDDMSIQTCIESISTEIRYFNWVHYPKKSLPSNFCAKRLIELDIRYGEVETLWEGVQDLANLRRLTLQDCKKLKELPDFSMACRLESVNLKGCQSLCFVHVTLLTLHSLISLNVSYCLSLEGLKSRIHLKSLKEIDMSRCSSLKEFCVSSEQLTSLNLDYGRIEGLNPSIVHCEKLRHLSLFGEHLKNNPFKVLSCLTFLEELCLDSMKIENDNGLHILFDHLHSLQSLSLTQCWNLTELPDNITQVSGLKCLNLEGCPDLMKLPLNMRHLSKLQYLNVKHCTALQSIPDLPPSLRELDAKNCTSLEMVSFSSTPHNGDKKNLFFQQLFEIRFGVRRRTSKVVFGESSS